MPPGASLTARRQLAILAALAILLLFLGLGNSALTDRDEGANAEAAREMLERRAWITPTLNYAPRFAKPAFVYWLIAGAYGALGITETAARLPSAAATAALIGLQYAFARWALGAAAGFRAALILLLTLEVVALGRMALTDAVLVLGTTAAGFAFVRAHHGTGPPGRWYAAMYAAMALATLAKGPVGVLVPLLGIAAYLVVAGGGGRAWREARPGWGLAFFLLVAGPWYGIMLWRHGGEYLARAQRETIGRAFRAVTGPGGTMLFYVPVVLVGLFPWSALLPSALLGALRGARARAAAGPAGATAVFAAVWVLVVLTFFSFFRSRLPHYVAPLFPAAALLLAATWPDRVPAAARALLAALGAMFGSALIAGGLAGTRITPMLALAYPAEAGAVLPPGVIGVGLLALAAAALAMLRAGGRLFVALAALTTALLATGIHAVLPGFDAVFVAPAGALARQAARVARPCDSVVVLGPYRPSLLFHARRPLSFANPGDGARLGEFAARPGRLFVLLPREWIGRLPPAWGTFVSLETRGGYRLLASPRPESPCE